MDKYFFCNDSTFSLLFCNSCIKQLDSHNYHGGSFQYFTTQHHLVMQLSITSLQEVLKNIQVSG